MHKQDWIMQAERTYNVNVICTRRLDDTGRDQKHPPITPQAEEFVLQELQPCSALLTGRIPPVSGSRTVFDP